MIPETKSTLVDTLRSHTTNKIIQRFFPSAVQAMNAAANRLAQLEKVLSLCKKTCGRNNCNCPGAFIIKKTVEDIDR